MAGYSRIYCIGGRGGFQGADGINPIRLQIWVGDADRQWLEPHYIDSTLRPLGALRSIIPETPHHSNALLDACIAFYPAHFRDCPKLAALERQLGGVTQLDFNLGKDEFLKEWSQLRSEARPHFRTLHIFEAELVLVDLSAELEA